MPWIVKESDQCPAGKPFGVFNKSTGRLIGCHSSADNAKKQQAALYAEVGDPADEARGSPDLEIERRTIPSEATLEYRDDPTTGEKVPVIVGYAAIFNSESRNLGGFTEVLEPTAFDAVLRTNPDVVGVWNHNKDMPLGRVSDGRLKLSVDPHGLRYELTPNPRTSIGHDLAIWVGDRTVQASSFAFAVDRDGGERWERGANGLRKRTISRVALLDDVSPVLRPAYDGTSVVVSRRALEQAAGEQMRPNQTMSNAAKRALRIADGRDDVDFNAIALANRISEREIVTFDEIPGAVAIMRRCLEAKSPTWAGSTAWIEYQLLGGDSGERWFSRRGVDEPPAPRGDEPESTDERGEGGVNLKPTAGMAAAARRGLKLHEDGRSGDGLKPETVSRAKRIAARETLTERHVREMRAWFRRHKVDRRPGWDAAGRESPGYAAFMLWGGAPAWRWSEAKVREMDMRAGKRGAEDPEFYEAFLAAAEEQRSHYEDEEPVSEHPEKVAMVYAAMKAAAEQYGEWTKEDERYMEKAPCRGDGYSCRMVVDPAADPTTQVDDKRSEGEGASEGDGVTTAAEPPASAPGDQPAKTSDNDDVLTAMAALDAIVLSTHLTEDSLAG